MYLRLQMLIRILAAIGLLSAAALVNQCTRPSRLESETAGTEAISDSRSTMPPGVAFVTVFLGGFRGLIADGLWIRASMLQEQGRYFELLQLADWITAMEPQFPQVWALQAWNMAYNVNVLMPDDESRWRWVRNGVELLRDRALPATGYAPEICLEIGSLFQLKIGGDADDRSDYFKQRWAEQMQEFIAADGTLDPAHSEALKTTLGMEPDIMLQLEARYGKLDWRVPASSAVYWAFRGLMQQPDDSSAILCRRMIYQSMIVLFEFGTLTNNSQEGVMVFSPAFDLLPGVISAFETALADDPVAAEGFANWLPRAIGLLMFYQRPTDAEPLFDILHARYPTAETSVGFDVFSRRRQPILPRIIYTKP